MRYTLKDYQVAATNEIVKVLRRAGLAYASDDTDLSYRAHELASNAVRDRRSTQWRTIR